MLLMGDEMRRTQLGNNNAYCQDNATGWMDWELLRTHADVYRFTRLLIARRTLRDATVEQQRLSLTDFLRQASTAWHGVRLWEPDWSAHSHSLAFGADLRRAGMKLHLILNAYWEPLSFELPPAAGRAGWRRWIDTALESPLDITPWQEAPSFTGSAYRTAPRSVVVLWAPSDSPATGGPSS
jgi:glycogen operon protein